MMDDVPVGFAFSLAQNEKALALFAGLDDKTKKQLIRRARQISSKQEMRDYVANLQDHIPPQ